MNLNNYKKSLFLSGISLLSIYGLYKSNQEKKQGSIIESVSLKETEELKKNNRNNLIKNLQSRLIVIENTQNNIQNDSKYLVDISYSDEDETFNIENPSVNDYKQEMSVDTNLKKYYDIFVKIQTNDVITPIDALSYFIKTKKTSLKTLKYVYKLCNVDFNMSLKFEIFCLICENIKNEI